MENDNPAHEHQTLKFIFYYDFLFASSLMYLFCILHLLVYCLAAYLLMYT